MAYACIWGLVTSRAYGRVSIRQRDGSVLALVRWETERCLQPASQPANDMSLPYAND